jgi:hypothetical protein
VRMRCGVEDEEEEDFIVVGGCCHGEEEVDDKDVCVVSGKDPGGS